MGEAARNFLDTFTAEERKRIVFQAQGDERKNNANHIHSVWRDLRDDWGEDLLRNHCKESHSRG
jgi:hypothetical protein